MASSRLSINLPSWMSWSMRGVFVSIGSGTLVEVYGAMMFGKAALAAGVVRTVGETQVAALANRGRASGRGGLALGLCLLRSSGGLALRALGRLSLGSGALLLRVL